jgi:hypothetical protein
MGYSKKYHKKVHNYAKKSKKNKHLAKSKSRRKKTYNKSRKQKGGLSFNSLVNNQFVWSIQDVGNNFLHTLSGTTIPASSNPTMDNFGK